MTDNLPADIENGDQRLADQIAALAEQIARGAMPPAEQVEPIDAAGADEIQELLGAIRVLTVFADDQATEESTVSFKRPPEVLGDFQLGREIGRGGLGVVYEATQISLGRRVAVKLLPPASRLDLRQLRRFEIEAQAAALLQHPNIVPTFAYGNACGVPYFAMRLIDGRNLAELIASRRGHEGCGLPPREVAELGRQAAEALDYAHRNEILHRDIKPSNLLVDSEQRLWIADFGLARIRRDSDLTASGDMLGTLRYLSPEQAQGRRGVVDGRSDVYSLGATLYELLTLRPAFEGDGATELLLRILVEEPRFSRTRDAAIPVDLKTIVLKALRRDPAERYATAGHLAADLASFLADQPIRARPLTPAARMIKRVRHHRKAVAAAVTFTALMLVGIVAAALWSNSRLRAFNEQLAQERDRADGHARDARELEREARASAQTAQRHALGAQLRLAAQAVDSAQAERAQDILGDIRRSAGGEGARSFVWRYLWHQARRDIIMLFGTARQVEMGLSPDGKQLAITDGARGLRLWDVASGGLIRAMELTPGQIRGRPTFSPDGTLVAAGDRRVGVESGSGFSIWQVATGRSVVRLPMGRDLPYLACAFLMTNRFLGAGSDPGLGIQRIRLWSLTNEPSPSRLLGEFTAGFCSDDASNGAEFPTLENGTEIVLRDARTGVANRRFSVETSGQRFAAFTYCTSTKMVAAITDPGWKLNVWDARSGQLLAVHVVPDDVYRLYFNPDGSKIAAIDRFEVIHLIDRCSGAVRRIGSAKAEHPRYSEIAFSPDSGRLATAIFGIERGREPDPVSIWDIATARQLATFPGRAEEVGKLAFLPDGRSLIISSKSSVRQWRLGPEHNDKVRQPAGHKDEAWSLAFAPDGRTLASGSDDSSADATIKLWNPATGQLIGAWRGGAGTVACLAYSPDGRFLASGHFDSSDNVRIWNATTGRRLVSLKGHTRGVRSLAFAPDGQSLATASTDGTVRVWDVATWRERQRLGGHADTVHAVAFSPDGKTLASAGNDGDVRLWQVRSSDGKTPSPPRVLTNRSNVTAVSFAPDGQTLAAADHTGAITIWNVETSTPIRLIHSDGDKLFQVIFTPDGTAVAAAGINGSIGFWDPATGQELLNLTAHHAQINGLAFSPDGSMLGSAAHDGSVHLWRAEP